MYVTAHTRVLVPSLEVWECYVRYLHIGSDLSEDAECCMAELRLAHCVKSALDDRHHCMHVEGGQYGRQLEGAQSTEREGGRGGEGRREREGGRENRWVWEGEREQAL